MANKKSNQITINITVDADLKKKLQAKADKANIKLSTPLVYVAGFTNQVSAPILKAECTAKMYSLLFSALTSKEIIQ